MNNVLFDSNILIYAHDTSSPFHEKSMQAIKSSLKFEDVFFSTQNYLEAFRIWTQKIPKPITGKQAWQIIQYYLSHSSITTIYPSIKMVSKLHELTDKYEISGVHIFDAQLVATMLEHNVKTIYTENIKDFIKFKEISVVNPLDLSSADF